MFNIFLLLFIRIIRIDGSQFALGPHELSVCAREANRLLCEQCLNLFYNLTRGGIPEAIRVNNLSIIDINAELTQSASSCIYLHVRFFIQLGCHTGSHHLLDGSNRAVLYGDFPHGFILLCGNELTTPYNCSARRE